MKQLKELDPVERAVIMATLLPDEKSDFLSFCEKFCDQISRGKKMGKEQIGGQNLKPVEWVLLATKMRKSLELHRALIRKPKQFAETFFQFSNLLFTEYCLRKYAHSPKCKSEAFKHAVKLFFL